MLEVSIPRLFVLRLGIVLVVSVVACGWMTSSALAQNITGSIVMSADRNRVQVGQTFRLEIRAEIQGTTNAQMQLPDLSAFDVVSRQSSSPIQFQLGPGGQTIQVSKIHRLGLRARATGRVTIEPARIVAGNQTYRSDSVTIEVGGSAAATPVSPANPSSNGIPPQGTGSMPATSRGAPQHAVAQYDDTLFLQTASDLAEVYVGQQVTVTLYLYVSQPLRRNPSMTQEPSTDGFWVRSLMDNRQLTPTTSRVGNRTFQVYPIRRFAAFPTRAGELSIGAPAISVQMGGGFFAAPTVVDRSGLPLSIQVRELPPTVPPNAMRHVGSLQLDASLDRSSAVTGDAVTLTLRAAGSGQLSALRFATPSIDGLRVLEPEIDDDIQLANGLVTGTRQVRWLIVPERGGEFEIPSFAVQVFDTRSEEYRTVRTSELRLSAAGRDVASREDASSASSEATTSTGPRPVFAPVRTQAALARSHRMLIDESWLPWAFFTGPLIFLCALLGLGFRRRALNQETRDPRGRARRVAKQRLAEAKRLLEAGDGGAFYANVATTIKTVLEAQLRQSVGSLTQPQLRTLMRDHGVDEVLVERMLEELEACDFARFSAAGLKSDEMSKCLERTRALVTSLQRISPRVEVKP